MSFTQNNYQVPKAKVPVYRVRVDASSVVPLYGKLMEEYVPESRATRLVVDSLRWLRTVQTTKGATIGQQRYAFLGFTEGQLKSGHVMLFLENEEWSVKSFKEALGNLELVFLKHGYGKYCARLGLSFSSTAAALNVHPSDAVNILDKFCEDGSTSSDGCGMITDSFATQVCTKLDISPDTCVFQIRRGGIKGLLTRYPDKIFNELTADKNRPGKRFQIAFRPSMLKYEGGPTILEVQGISRSPRNARLNIQFVVLLLTLGIPLTAFKNLLNIQIEQIHGVTTSRERALECIKGELDSDGQGFDQELFEMLLAGQNLSDPRVARLLQSFERRSLDSLHKKLNINVQDSAYLYGVVDELGVLEEGEVYINLPLKGGVQVKYVLVGRNPAYAAGDLRRLRAVYCPELAHLTNCIVFSSKGKRSETDKMGGGDLDGDEYLTIFDTNLIPEPHNVRLPVPRPIQSTSVSRCSSSSTRRRTTGPHTPVDMSQAAVEVFLNLRCNFFLGKVAKAWSAEVGLSPRLAESPTCSRLVPILEAALDSTKSGNDIRKLETAFEAHMKMTKTLRAPSNPGWTNPIDTLRSLVPQPTVNRVLQFICDPDLILDYAPDWSKQVVEGAFLMTHFNQDLSVAIADDKEAGEIKLGEKNVDRIKRLWTERYFGSCGPLLSPEHMVRASAWYSVSYRENREAFAWIGQRVLNYLKAHASAGNRFPISVGSRRTKPPREHLTSIGSTALATPSAPPDIDMPLARAVSSKPLTRSSSECTLVEEDPLECPELKVLFDEDPPLRTASVYPTKPLRPSNQPIRATIIPPTITYTRDKPSHPVATDPSICSSGSEHQWRIQANASAVRGYRCKACPLIVKERWLDDNGWQSITS